MIEEKYIKLLADPNKLKSNQSMSQENYFKYQIESKFNNQITLSSYNYIVTIIKETIVIQDILNDIINQIK
tara:strand:- start:89 stop:301 length:213 start_codon:yes stop_codon:yes gene_type:complete